MCKTASNKDKIFKSKNRQRGNGFNQEIPFDMHGCTKHGPASLSLAMVSEQKNLSVDLIAQYGGLVEAEIGILTNKH